MANRLIASPLFTLPPMVVAASELTSHTVSGLDCVTCFDQQDTSKCPYQVRSLISTCMLGLVLLKHPSLEISRYAMKQLGLNCRMMRCPKEREKLDEEGIVHGPATVQFPAELPAARSCVSD